MAGGTLGLSLGQQQINRRLAPARPSGAFCSKDCPLSVEGARTPLSPSSRARLAEKLAIAAAVASGKPPIINGPGRMNGRGVVTDLVETLMSLMASSALGYMKHRKIK